MNRQNIHYPSRDGLLLEGDLFLPNKPRHLVLMVHGITSDRTEDGLYPSIAAALYKEQVASLAFDFRAHGATKGAQENLTLAGVLNDVLASIRYLQSQTGIRKLSIIAASFGGGISVRAACIHNKDVRSVTLLNPRLEYLTWVTKEKYWSKECIRSDAAAELYSKGYLIRNSFRMGIGLINEMFHFDPASCLRDLNCRVLFIHGTDDTVIPISTSRERYNENGNGRLLEIRGAEHGFVNPVNESTDDPLSQKFRQQVFEATVKFILEHASGF